MSAWKDLEREVARRLGGDRILTRAYDFGRSAPDVEIPGAPWVKVDTKHRSGPWKHHSLLEEIRRKYCHDQVDVPVLVTREKYKRRLVAVVDLDFFAALLERFCQTG